MNRKSIFGGLLALLAVFGLLVVFDVQACSPEKGPVIVGYEYDRGSGDFTLYVESKTPWVVWWKPDLNLPWVKVSKVQGVGKKEWTDYGAGLDGPIGFYKVLPKGDKPVCEGG